MDKKTEKSIDIPEAGGEKLDIPTFLLNSSSEAAINPNNTFEIKFKDDTLISFKGGNN